MLEVRGLKKAYGKIVAVDGVSLRAGSAETIGLLGPNGAGKTTTVSMIAGLFPPDSGEVLIDGRPLRGDTDPVKRKIGLVPDRKSTRLNSSHLGISYAVFCLKKKNRS